MIAPQTELTVDKVSCMYCPTALCIELQPCTESSLPRAWPVPIALLSQIDEYERWLSARSLTKQADVLRSSPARIDMWLVHAWGRIRMHCASTGDLKMT